MIDSVSSVATFAFDLQQQKLVQQVDTAVLKKSLDIQEQQGQSALQLLESAKVNNGIDVHV